MRLRKTVIFSGHRFMVPPCVQRIDSDSTHGWQVRYQGTRLFSDGTPDGSGAKKALDAAIKELLRRIATLPAPVTLKRAPSAHKTSDLPPGISGPIVRDRQPGTARSATLSVMLPRFGGKSRVQSVYIGNENTYTRQRYREALAKAVALRKAAEEKYVVDATRARRREAKELRAALRAG